MLAPRAEAKAATRANPSAPPRRIVHPAAALALLASVAMPAHAASSAEWLASTDGPSPIVTAKSGVGTAQATATAKVTSDVAQDLLRRPGRPG